ncbi:MAG: NADH:ubiquinone reductase (Na(+)-transporting) subunit C [Prevotellaceae bacterium]|jgi:Na+-transporting NADH:ubiquinone oxidoreductase subunit C|nr:NADH:ubiquinone reductase (Na(+)-transporting) subunit C [Prevotellaceae bacterium]
MEKNSDKKKININSNIYTIVYSIVIVIIVAVLLTIASTALKPAQKLNIKIEKQENILKTVGKAKDAGNVKDKAAYIEQEYEKYIVESYLVGLNGNKKDGDAFTTELKAELVKPAAERSLPIFVCQDGDSLRYVVQLYGKGLWGPIWGYVAFKSDMNTIVGVVFDHEGETPGLGAEITTEGFQTPFAGKQIFSGNNLTSITIQKPGGTSNNHTVDGISGGTITSRGVQTMLADNLKLYNGFFNKMKSENENKLIETNENNTSDE